MQQKNLPPGYHGFMTYMTVDNCADAIEFYKRAFGASEVGRITTPDGKVGHAEIEINGDTLFISDEMPGWENVSAKTLGKSPTTLCLYVDDADAVHKQAVDAGAKELHPVVDQFYGDRAGDIEDPFGNKWAIATRKREVSWDEMQQKFTEMLNQQASS